MVKFNVVREVNEIKNQISYSKNIGFFFGAGSSTALGIPNIAQLTEAIKKSLTGDYLKYFEEIKTDLESNCPDKKINIEDILNQIRRIRDITYEHKERAYLSINGEEAKYLDLKICELILQKISEEEEKVSLDVTKKFLAWFSMQNKDTSKEIFTTNYDMILEKSLELSEIPYFDGFVGSFEPFFWQESIDTFVGNNDLTKNWVRLWKIHGSLNWFWKTNMDNGTLKIIRGDRSKTSLSQKNELVIYPSREKYISSKKQPFVAYFDRLKNYLLNGELLFIFSGYSFSDQHINELIFNCLRQNNRFFCLIFFYNDSEVEKFFELSLPCLNLNVFGPTKAIINGSIGELEISPEELKDSENCSKFWDVSGNYLSLGDFNRLTEFLISTSVNKSSFGDTSDGK
ncbi:MAG: SIR2 family protein [Treponema sp.]|nr:SIR2 family protein [Treponema sp.]